MIWQKNSLRLLNICLKLLYDSNTSNSGVEYSSSTTGAKCIVVRLIFFVSHVTWCNKCETKSFLLLSTRVQRCAFVRAT